MAVADFSSLAPYTGLVAITRELGPKNWLAEALPRADRLSWLEIWCACEALFQRAGLPAQRAIVRLTHQARERVLVATFSDTREAVTGPDVHR